MCEDIFDKTMEILENHRGSLGDPLYRLATEDLVNDTIDPQHRIKLHKHFEENPLGLTRENFCSSKKVELPFKDLMPLCYPKAIYSTIKDDGRLKNPLILVQFKHDRKLRLVDGSHRLLEYKNRNTADNYKIETHIHEVSLSDTQLKKMEEMISKVKEKLGLK